MKDLWLCTWLPSVTLGMGPNKIFLLGEFVAQFKFTVMLMANGPLRITGGPLEPELYQSEHDVQDPELKVSSATQDESESTPVPLKV